MRQFLREQRPGPVNDALMGDQPALMAVAIRQRAEAVPFRHKEPAGIVERLPNRFRAALVRIPRLQITPVPRNRLKS
jgi:hypothetical protein